MYIQSVSNSSNNQNDKNCVKDGKNNTENISSDLIEIKYENSEFIIKDGLKYGTHLLFYTDSVEKVHSKYSALYDNNFNTSQAIIYQRLSQNVNKEFILIRKIKDCDIKGEKFLYQRIKRFL